MTRNYSSSLPVPHTRKLQILAQDPTVKVGREILSTEVDVPDEELEAGPRGYRVYVVDYDVSTGRLYPAAEIPVRPANPAQLIDDFAFHAQNVYAIVMRTLARFEFALGRRLSWSFDGHQLHASPHAFVDANAFYSKNERGLFFGYFQGTENNTVYTCLSHDVVAHETTHALLDGLRSRYTMPFSPDQAAFHEGFADIVALLSIFSLPGVVEGLLDEKAPKKDQRFVERRWLDAENLRSTALFGVGEEIDPRRGALRRSVELRPNKEILKQAEFREEHRRGEVLVAAVMNAFLNIWLERIRQLGDGTEKKLLRSMVAEQGMATADHLLTMCVRALDYAPVVDIQFGDFLTSMLTADLEVQPDDRQHAYRDTLRNSFRDYGIGLAPTKGNAGIAGVWEPPNVAIDYSKVHFESLRQDPDEVFRFMWENRGELGLNENAYTRVQSVRPCVRLSTDGFLLRETVAEYVQILNLSAGELGKIDIKLPKKMRPDTEIWLYGGGAVIFDEFGRLKYHVRNRVTNAERQTARLRYLWEVGFFDEGGRQQRGFAEMHRLRMMAGVPEARGENDHGEYF